MCRFCKGPVEPPKLTFCSKDCVHEWLVRSDVQYMRTQIFSRDHGICRECGLDTTVLAKKLRKLYEETRADWAEETRALRLDPEKQHGSLWQADHILPVWKGGGECGLSGLQTLCLTCHTKKSSNEATERAAMKKAAKQKRKKKA